ncbi:hypothetical protein EV426DRAFT_687689 [Tirmania nivea]|nr:hypothetical protein EV426DRAFT_687689 [Tirmania nivea]
MNRKRPSPGAAPIPSSNVQAGYLNSTPSSSTAINSNGILATAGPYGHVNGAVSLTSSPNSAAETSDLYNLANGNRAPAATSNAAQALNLGLNDSNQVARITNRNNQLMRIPQGSYYSGPGHTAGLGENSQILGAGTGMPTGVGNLDIYGDLAPMIRKAKGKKANIPPFVQKLSQFVNDPKCDHLIRWSPSGTSFLVLDEDEFSKTLIPDLFKHNNYASFVRQLNMYGFHKVVGLADGSLKTSEQRSKPPSEYKNDFFIRGMPDLMWLIQKPKNTTKRSKGRKKGKAEDSDEDGGSDRDVMSGSGILDDSGQLQPNGGVFIEAPPSQHVQGTIPKNQVDVIIQQLDQLRAHQQVMTNAINRLRKDHTQLYEQSIAFQTLHDRHEHSISAILTFLATVYDKSIGGHLNSQTLQNLFQGAVDQSQNAGQVMGSPGNAVANMGRAGVVGMGNGQPRTPFKRRPLMLPPVPSHVSGSGVLKIQNDNQNQNQQQQQQQQQQQHQSPDSFNNTYRSPSIQEVFTPATGQLSPSPGSPALSNSQLNTSFFPGIFGNRDDNIFHQQAMTPRQLTRAMAPLLRVAEQQKQLEHHNKKVAETHSGIEQMAALQDQQNENINRLMEIVGPYATTRETSPIHSITPIPNSPPASGVAAVAPAPSVTGATTSPVVTAAVPKAAVVATDGASVPGISATASEQLIDVENVASANNGALPLHQTPSPLATGNYGHIPPPPGVSVGGGGDPTAGFVGGDTSGEYVDIDQYLQEEGWPGIDDYPPAVDDGIPGAAPDLSLDTTLFDMETGFGQGYMGGGLHGMGAMGMGAQGNGLGMGRLGVDGIGHVLGTNPSTAVGSPQSPAFSDGTASLLDGNMGNIEENLSGSAKKKRRIG